jgi:putative ABC transport system ATP-binding protein
MILRLSNVYKDYTQGTIPVRVLKDINLEVDDSEYLAIMGPSGSGKTTLMNIIGCLDIPTSGKYEIEGKDVSGLSDREMAEIRNKYIGFVFQSFNLLSRQSAIENVMLPLLYAGINKAKRLELAEAALEKVGLADRMQFKPNQLSGGQCQRVAVARAIVNSPCLLLADEPTGALDSASGEQLMEIFQQLNDEGVTIIMITHEDFIARRAKRIVTIRDGILSFGPESDGPQAAPEPGADAFGFNPTRPASDLGGAFGWEDNI